RGGRRHAGPERLQSAAGRPYFCIDAPGGVGKIPILPKYLQSINDEQVVLRNYAGELFVYPQVRQKPKRKPRPSIAPCYNCDAPV
ncbi:MAG: hypothetical protein R6X21_10635, partial [Candidatus Aminicenantes bacterium]